jgi:alanine dehydrogenase
MKIIIPKETASELRVSMLPQNVEKLVKKGAKVIVESGLGRTLGISDNDYQTPQLKRTEKSSWLPGILSCG